MEQRLTDMEVQLQVMKRVWEYEYQKEIPLVQSEPKKEKPLLEIPEDELKRLFEERMNQIEGYRQMEQRSMPRSKK